MSWLNSIKEKFILFIDKDARQYVEPPGIGIGWLWQLPDNHPFYRASLTHDAEYELMLEGKSVYRSSKIPDLTFYRECVIASAGQDNLIQIEYYLAQAKTFYLLISMWGKIRWRSSE